MPFVVADALSLIDPQAFYDKVLIPSLIALYLSLLIVFVVYPLFASRVERRPIANVVYASAAAALMLYGLYTVAANQLGAGG